MRNCFREKGFFFKICEIWDYVGMFVFLLFCKLYCEFVFVYVCLFVNRMGIEGLLLWCLFLDLMFFEDNFLIGVKMMRRDLGVVDYFFV